MQLGRRRSISLLFTTMLALAVLGAPAASAQSDPVSDSICASLTVDEVNAALGATVAAEPGFEACTWASDGTDGSYGYLSANWSSQSFESTPEMWPGGTALVIGERPAYFLKDYGMLFVQLDQGVLLLTLGTSAAVDTQVALQGLAALIVARSSTLLGPTPPPTPAPVPHADPGLEALFPQSIGGQPVTLQSMAGSEIFSSDNEGTAAFLAALTANGKTMDDVSIASGFPSDFSSSIFAIRIAGGDATVFAPLLLATMDSESTQAPAQVAGKDVTTVTSGTNVQYVYPKNDVIWGVTAKEPALSEIFAALP